MSSVREYFELGNGVRMPSVGFGTWDVRGEKGKRVVQDAIDRGYRLIDTAEMYANEDIVGEAVRGSGVPRDDIFITTKISAARDRDGTADAIDKALRRLDMSYVDLLLIHEPYSSSGEMYAALEDALSRGKARAIGVSNFGPRLIDGLISSSGVVPMVDQVESSVYFPQKGFAEGLRAKGIQPQSWGPFTEGRRRIFGDPVLLRVGAEHGRSAAQVALRYLLQCGIAVIPKSSRKERMEENLDVFGFELSDGDMREISKLDGGESLFGWYKDELMRRGGRRRGLGY